MKRFIKYELLNKLNMDNIKFYRRIRSLGGSLIVTLDKEISDLICIKENDMIEVIINKNLSALEIKSVTVPVRVKVQGGSFFITLDKETVSALEVVANEMISIEIKRIIDGNVIPLVEFRCKKCEHRFAQNDIVPFCPVCECEDLEVLEIENEQTN